MMNKLTSNVPNLRYGLCVGIVCLLSVLSVGQAPPTAEADRKAGERMSVAVKDVEYAFRWCPPGKFMMGSPEDEGGMEADEAGTLWEMQHEVTVSLGFWMSETEVTQAMWESVMGNNPSEFKGAKLPVESVSWNDCQEFIKKLNDMKVAPAGFKFSLPTEAQWEYTCRASTTTAYHFGDSLSAEQANFGNNVRQTKEVGSYPANTWGLKDMHGNVGEWCLDWLAVYPSGTVTDPIRVFPPVGSLLRGESERVFRGGTWRNVAWGSRSANRMASAPSDRCNLIGLRLSLVLE